MVAEGAEDVASVTRRRVRDAFAQTHLLERMVHDIRFLLLGVQEEDDVEVPDAELLRLWDERGENVRFGVSYRERGAGGASAQPDDSLVDESHPNENFGQIPSEEGNGVILEE